MKTTRSLFAASAVILLAAVSFAQTHTHDAKAAKPTKPEAQVAFQKLKSLAGTWEGTLTSDPPVAAVMGKTAQVKFQVASMGNTVVHDMKIEGRPDHPFTMMVVDGDRLLLTHYCDANNRPRMVGKVSPDGKTVSFDFLDVSGNMKYGHMARAVFTIIDENHHIEEWTFMEPGDKPTVARFELRRTGTAAARAGSSE